jgi:hypothetical protein
MVSAAFELQVVLTKLLVDWDALKKEIVPINEQLQRANQSPLISG